MSTELIVIIATAIAPTITTFIVRHYLEKMVKREDDRRLKEQLKNTIIIENLFALQKSVLAIFDRIETLHDDNTDLELDRKELEHSFERLQSFLIESTSKN